MKGFTKKILAAVLSLTLVIGLATSASAAAWDEYFGQNQGWYEGALGNLTGVSASGFTAKMEQIGWGGVWGCRVYKKISLKKGVNYAVTFKAKSTRLDKYIYVKFGSDDNFAGGFWVKLPRGKNVSVSHIFKSAVTTRPNDELSFGLGGDYGDRAPVAEDGDRFVRYAQFKKQFGKEAKVLLAKEEGAPLGADSSVAPTDVTISGLKIGTAPSKVKFSAKAKGKKKVKVTFKKAAGIKTFEVKVGKVKKKTTKTSITVKAKKKGKQKVQVRGISADKAYKTKWATKKVKVK